MANAFRANYLTADLDAPLFFDTDTSVHTLPGHTFFGGFCPYRWGVSTRSSRNELLSDERTATIMSSKGKDAETLQKFQFLPAKLPWPHANIHSLIICTVQKKKFSHSFCPLHTLSATAHLGILGSCCPA